MNKKVIGVLIATFMLTCIAITPVNASINSKSVEAATTIEETFTISTEAVNDMTGECIVKVVFSKEEYNSVLVINDNGKEIYRTKIVPATKELTIPIKLSNYDVHELKAYLGIVTPPTFNPYTSSNTIKLGYFNNSNIKDTMSIDHSKINDIQGNFKINLPRECTNMFLNVYNNGVLIHSAKLVRPGMLTYEFTSNINYSKNNNIKAYIGLYSFGSYGFNPIIASNLLSLSNSTNVDKWVENKQYIKGDVVVYNNKEYVCLQSHTSLISWEPNVAYSLWALK